MFSYSAAVQSTLNVAPKYFIVQYGEGDTLPKEVVKLD
jgi:hypothetical protein